MTVQLHARQSGEGAAVVLLHGLFGSGPNLGALARALDDRFAVYSLDLPNHGRSGWLDEPDLAGMASSVLGWMDQERLAQVFLVGHSLGGKVAMELALSAPDRVRGLVVADIAPVDYPARHDAVFAALRAVSDANCTSRGEAARVLETYLEEEGVAQFLLMSLSRQDGRMDWRFDRAGLERAYPALVAAPKGGREYRGPTLFLKGERSDYILASQRQQILSLFPAATLRVVAGAGHWLHAEKPALFNALVARFLDAAPAAQAMEVGAHVPHVG
jgi:esterase